MKINKITGSGNSVAISNVWQGTRATGLTHIVPVTDDGSVRLVRYSQATGAVTFDRVNADGQGIVNVGAAELDDAVGRRCLLTASAGPGTSWPTRPPGWRRSSSSNAAGSAISVLSTQGWTLGLA